MKARDPRSSIAARWRATGARTALNIATGIASVGVILALWQWWVGRHPVFFLPTPADIAGRLESDWLAGPAESFFLTAQAREAIAQTFTTALVGWAIAAAVGICAGAVLGTRRGLVAVAEPPLLILRSIPPIAVIPIAIVILGLGTSMRVAVVISGCIWPVLFNAMAAIANVDPVLRDLATLNRLNPVSTFRRILIPAASPELFAGLRVALSLAIVLAVGSEMFAGTGGLGGALLASHSTFDVPALWATLTVLAILGALVNVLLLLVERIALRWNTQEGTR